jgi:hypothetical protein
MTLDVRKQYEAAWDRLFDLVKQRNLLLADLAKAALFASDFTPAAAMFFEFDIDQARRILATVNEMTPTIYTAIDELNAIGVQIGKPKIERRSFRL